jgi:cell wall-associated NlpC family hydrolase
MLPESFADYGYEKFHGMSYQFGGKYPPHLDCSGFVSQCLKAYGHLPNNSLKNSQMLYDYFKERGINSSIEKDSLLFFGRSVDEIDHVAIAMNEKQMIEAAGEGRIPTERGFVRVRPIFIRGDLVAVIKLDLH